MTSRRSSASSTRTDATSPLSEATDASVACQTTRTLILRTGPGVRLSFRRSFDLKAALTCFSCSLLDGPHDRLFTKEETELVKFEPNPQYGTSLFPLSRSFRRRY